MRELTEAERILCRENDYIDPVYIGDKLCAISFFVTTVGLVVGITPMTYDKRYCYKHYGDAYRALHTWDGKGHAPGKWLKVKGIHEGQVVNDWRVPKKEEDQDD